MRQRISPELDYAVVAGIDLNGLGVVRALARANVPVIALDTDISKATAATRHGIKVQVSALSGDAFVDDLLRLRERFERNPVLFLTQEASVGTISASRDRIDSAYRFTMPDDSVMRTLLDKSSFQVLAERQGFPVPRAVHLTNDTAANLKNLRYPCVLKPAAKDPEYGRKFAKAYKVGTAEEAVRLWEQVRRTVDRVIVQEWIEGGDSDVFFCLQYRTPTQSTASFVGRKLCQWPPLVGGTASCMPAREFDAELSSLTDRFFTAAGFAGMGSMEYKRDRRDGRFYMIEPTVGRTDHQEEVAVLNGVNIPFAAFTSELGLRFPEPQESGPPRVWRDPIASARSRDVGAEVPQVSRQVRTYDAYFRASDPGPYAALKWQGVRNRWSRILRRTRQAAALGSNRAPSC